MTAFCIGHITVTDPARWEEYRARVAATVSLYGGEVLLRGDWRACFSGRKLGENAVVLRFADALAARAWHDSPEYQALVALRDAGARVTLELYEN
jgi:uncharacterized protein (DUF1330 family)